MGGRHARREVSVGRDRQPAPIVRGAFLNDILVRIGMGLVIAVLLLLFIGSLAETYGFPSNGLERSRAMGVLEAILSVPASMALACLLLLLCRRLERTSPRAITHICCVVAVSVAICWAALFQASKPVADQMLLVRCAKMLVGGDYQGLQEQGYLLWHPYQSGYMLLDAAIGYLFGFANWTALRLPGIASAPALIWVLSRLVDEALGHPEASALTSVMATSFLPISLYSTFIYGNMPSLTLSLLGFLCQVRAIRYAGDRSLGFRWGLASVFCISAAVWLKPNSTIFLVALEIVWVCAALSKRTIMCAGMLVLSLLGYCVGTQAPIAVVEMVSGVDLGAGIPKAAWATMGLMDTSKRGAGWYNGYVEKFRPYAKANTTEATNEANELATADLEARIGELLNDPSQAVRIFAFKLQSQWAEPTFQALWLSYHGDYPPPWGGEGELSEGIDYDSVLQRTFLLGKGNKLLILFLDGLQTLVYAGSVVGSLLLCKERTRLWRLGLPIAFMGGFIFHMVWEAKSCYVLSYFILLIPLAAIGVQATGKHIKARRAHGLRSGSGHQEG